MLIIKYLTQKVNYFIFFKKSVISYMNLIVVTELTNNDGLYFRYISMMAKTELDYDVLIEAREEDVDKYYKLLKSKGWFDFVDDFVLPNQEEGVRIDTELSYPMTIQVPYIKCENTLNLLGQLKSLRNIF